MPANPSTNYIVRARESDGALAAFMRGIASDPDITLVDQIGPKGAPHTLVISVAADKAAAVEERFRNQTQLMLERDRPLSLF